MIVAPRRQLGGQEATGDAAQPKLPSNTCSSVTSTPTSSTSAMSSAGQSLRPSSSATRSLMEGVIAGVPQAALSASSTGVTAARALGSHQAPMSATGTPKRQSSRKKPVGVSLYGWPLPQTLRTTSNAPQGATVGIGVRPSPQHVPAPASNKFEYSSSPHRRFSVLSPNIPAPDARHDPTALALISANLQIARPPARVKQSPAPECGQVLVCLITVFTRL